MTKPTTLWSRTDPLSRLGGALTALSLSNALVIMPILLCLWTVAEVRSARRQQTDSVEHIHDQVVSHLATAEEFGRGLALDIRLSCGLAPQLGLLTRFYAYDGSGRQLCGPTVDHQILKFDEWVRIGDYITHATITSGGEVSGILQPAADLLSDELELIRAGVALFHDDRLLWASRADGLFTSGDKLATYRGVVVRPLTHESTFSVAISFEKPIWRMFPVAILLTWAIGLFMVVGAFGSRFVYPYRRWPDRTEAPDGAQFLMLDRNGVIRSASAHECWYDVGRRLRDRFNGASSTVVDSMLQRAHAGEGGPSEVVTTVNGDRVQLTVLAWLPLLRRFPVLATFHRPDIFVDVMDSTEGSKSATLVDPDGIVVLARQGLFIVVGAADVPQGTRLVDYFDPRSRIDVQRLLDRSRDSPFLLTVGTVIHRWQRIRITFLSDPSGRTYTWFDDRTAQHQGIALSHLVNELADYLQYDSAPRPDLSHFRKKLDPRCEVETGSDLSRGERHDGIDRLIGMISSVVQGCDVARAGRFGGFDQLNAAAMGKEHARLLHDEVVQEFVMLGWRHGADPVSLGCVERGSAAARRVIERLRIPPWEYGMVHVLRSHARGAADLGIDVKVHVELPKPLPVALAAAVDNVAREAIINALRHAGAKSIEVGVVERAGVLTLIVSDDGLVLNADTATKGFGLMQCHELAVSIGGSFTFDQDSAGHLAVLTVDRKRACTKAPVFANN